MADWTSITDSQVDPDAPLTSELAYAWRDNPIAIAEGALGAPRIDFPAMGTWFSTYNSVGTYALGQKTAAGATDPGITVAGSSIRPSPAQGTAVTATLTGTWRCMGRVQSGDTSANSAATTLWMRIS